MWAFTRTGSGIYIQKFWGHLASFDPVFSDQRFFDLFYINIVDFLAIYKASLGLNVPEQ